MSKENLTLIIEEHGMKNVRRALKELDSAAGGTSKSFGVMAVKMAAVAAVGAGLYKVVQIGKEFEKEMAKTKSVTMDTSKSAEQLNAEWARLEENARKLGGSTLYTATEVAGLQTEFAKLGFSIPEIENLSAATLDLALITGTDLSNAAVISGQAVRAFGMDASQAGEVIDIMAASFSSSALDIDKFSNSMTYVAPVAKAAGFTIDETTAVLGTLANVGIDGSIAGTQLRLIFGELANGSSKLSKKLGGPIDDLDDLIPKLKEMSADGFTATEAFELVGRRAAPALLSLVENTDNLDELAQGLENATGAAEAMADTQLDTFAAQMEILGSASSELALKIFDLVEGPLKSLVESFGEFVGDIDEEEIKSYGVALAAVAVVLGIKAGAWTAVTAAIKLHRAALVSTGYGALIVAVGLAAGALMDYFNVFDDGTETVEENTKETEDNTKKVDELKSRQQLLAEAIGEVLQKYEDLKYTPQEALSILNEETGKLEKTYIDAKNAFQSVYDIQVDEASILSKLTPELRGYIDANNDGTVSNWEYSRAVGEITRVDEKREKAMQEIASQITDDVELQKKLISGIGLEGEQRRQHLIIVRAGSEALNKQQQFLWSLNDVYGESTEVLLENEKSIRALVEEKRADYEASRLAKEANEAALQILADKIATGQTEIELIEKITAGALEAEEAQRFKNATTLESVMIDLELLESSGLLKEETFELTEATRDQISERIRQGESADQIIDGYMREGETLKSLTQAYTDFQNQQDESNRKRAESIAFGLVSEEAMIREVDNLGKVTEKKYELTEADVELLEGKIAEGATQAELNELIQTEILGRETLDFVKEELAEKESVSLQERWDAINRYNQLEKEGVRMNTVFAASTWTQANKHHDAVLEERRKALLEMGMDDAEITQHFTREKAKMQWQGANVALQGVAGGMAALGKMNAKYADAAKRTAQSVAIINTLESATKTAKETPWPWNIATVIGALAQGYAQVKAIGKQNFGPPETSTETIKEPPFGGITYKKQFGGDHLVTKPTRFEVGEGGSPEAVSVRPLGVANAKAGLRRGTMGGGANITLNVSAPLIDEHILDVIIPEIQDAMRRGEQGFES